MRFVFSNTGTHTHIYIFIGFTCMHAHARRHTNTHTHLHAMYHTVMELFCKNSFMCATALHSRYVNCFVCESNDHGFPFCFCFFSFVPFAHVCTFRFDLDLNVTVLPQMIQLTEQDSINTFIFYLLEFRFHFLCTKWEELVDCVCVHVCVCVCVRVTAIAS